MNIKAIQNGCVEEAIEELIVEETVVLEKIVAPEVVEVSIGLKNKFTGLVVNSNTEKNIAAIVSILDYKGEPNRQIISTVNSGFSLENYVEDKVIVSVNKLGYETFLDTIDLSSGEFKIELNPIKVGEKLVMDKVSFHPNTYVLKEDSKIELNKLLEFMLGNKSYSFEIQGHTNGNRAVKTTKRYAHLGVEWNYKGSSKKLSKLRAEKIKAYLIENGVNETQLETGGYGGDRMIVAKPKNMSQAMKNIRVEVIVVQ